MFSFATWQLVNSVCCVELSRWVWPGQSYSHLIVGTDVTSRGGATAITCALAQNGLLYCDTVTSSLQYYYY